MLSEMLTEAMAMALDTKIPEAQWGTEVVYLSRGVHGRVYVKDEGGKLGSPAAQKKLANAVRKTAWTSTYDAEAYSEAPSDAWEKNSRAIRRDMEQMKIRFVPVTGKKGAPGWRMDFSPDPTKIWRKHDVWPAE